eukprot:g3458.t1
MRAVWAIVGLAGAVCGTVPPSLQRFVWPDQWRAIQTIHMVTGNYTGAVQRGRIAYDWVKRRTREDQQLLQGPPVATSYTSNNMTEWFHNMTWYYVDWTAAPPTCMSMEYGFGQVKPDWLVDAANGYPTQTGSTFILAYNDSAPGAATREARAFVNVSWVQVDGSAGFGDPPGSSLFEWHVDANGRARRMRMPSTLSSDLMADLSDFEARNEDADFDLPPCCSPGAVQQWPHGPVTPLARRFAAAAAATMAA